MAERKFYEKMEILLSVPKARGEEFRVVIGTKEGRDGQPVQYVDVRTWYPDDYSEELQPGKGVAAPDENGLWDQIALAILHRSKLRHIGKTVRYVPKLSKTGVLEALNATQTEQGPNPKKE